MKKILTGTGICLLGVVLVVGGSTLVARTAPKPQPGVIGPTMVPDTGAGELLVVVVGGVYGTLADAETANAQIQIGDVQGYYVVPVAQFQGFNEQIGSPGAFALASAFRTQDGAEAFAETLSVLGYPATVLQNRVRSLGGLFAGLGQEANPDGSGPVVGPIPESLP